MFELFANSGDPDEKPLSAEMCALFRDLQSLVG